MIFNRYGGIGDVICTIPAALELKKRHPGVDFIFNCHADYACLLRLGGVTSHTTSVLHIGTVGYWYRFLLSGFYPFASDDDRPNQAPSDVYIKDFARQFGLTVDDAHPRLRSDLPVLDRMKLLLEKEGLGRERFIVIQTGPSWLTREWPHESWAALIQELKQRGYHRVIRLGTTNHLAMGTTPSTPIPGTISLVDQLTLEESLALIELADLFIGIDSGLLHAAAAVGTPLVGLWGPTSSEFRFSVENRRLFVTSRVTCQGCHHRFPRLHWMTGCPFDIECMKTIGVPEVLQACLSGLEETQRSL